MKNKKSKELNVKNERNRLLIILIGIVLVMVAVGSLIYLLGNKQGISGQVNSEQDANVVLSKVKMNMTKDEVVATVGQPRSCSPTEKSGSNVMEQCYYGKEDADGHAHVTFLDGKVWGTTYEKGALPPK